MDNPAHAPGPQTSDCATGRAIIPEARIMVPDIPTPDFAEVRLPPSVARIVSSRVAPITRTGRVTNTPVFMDQ